jgi:cellulose synthase/poly-beta-1,6-N-acetylglucosamine synthase-like glycosyltransferase
MVVTTVLLGYAGSRGLAIWAPRRAALPRRPLRAAELPDYSVLIPLYREEEDGLRQLVRALRRIDYPPDKLDIQFLVERDDPGTCRAILAAAQGLPCRVTVVPPGLPRTKPRALNVGFRQARGRLLTIFDAEDRPDPAQLRIAAETFAAAPPELAALQARLAIDHGADSWLTRMFAIEYACQFDHILPMVASRGGLVLLGGTSNHFRIEALARVGGWDPYNVTEDADLSVRLRRRGYRIATIDTETHEEAPTTVAAWLKQRSRWFKGYMQTWLVHNRRPLELVRAIGLRDAFLFHLFIVGALTAALAHIVFLLQLGLALAGAPVLVGGTPALVALQMGAVVAGYGASLGLGALSVRRRRDPRLRLSLVLSFPAYWLLMGAAVLVALHDLVRRPHHWHKTQHGLAARPLRRPCRCNGAVRDPADGPPRPAGEA